MPNTIGDFWRLIWEHRLDNVVMLTKVKEGTKVSEWCRAGYHPHTHTHTQHTHTCTHNTLTHTHAHTHTQTKCEMYWPDKVGDTYNPPMSSLSIIYKELLPFADYEIRKFFITDVSMYCVHKFVLMIGHSK